MKYISTLLLMLALSAQPLFAGPAAILIPGWDDHDPNNTATVDHSDWQAILDHYLEIDSAGQSYFNYKDVSDTDRQRLQRYLTHMANTDPLALNRDVQMAYWLNLYNAATVELVLEHYPVRSIRRIHGGLFNTGPWNENIVAVGDSMLSLNDIEHGILRPIWQDPRIHYAVNCASLGCPNLMPEAFQAEALEAQLDKAALAFVNHPRGVDIEGSTLRLSTIFRWYSEDFGDSTDALIEHLSQYANPRLREQLASHSGRIRYDYDWALNETP